MEGERESLYEPLMMSSSLKSKPFNSNQKFLQILGQNLPHEFEIEEDPWRTRRGGGDYLYRLYRGGQYKAPAAGNELFTAAGSLKSPLRYIVLTEAGDSYCPPR